MSLPAVSPAAPQRIAELLEHWARCTPDAPALWEAGQPLSYAALARLRDAGASLLRERQVHRGDRVLIVAENGSAPIALYFAASALGAWPVLANARLNTRELQSIRDHCSPRVAILFETGGAALETASRDPSARERAFNAIVHEDPALGRLAISTGAPAQAHGAARPETGPESEPLASEVAALIYTSGTTGAAKGVMVTHRGLLHFAAHSAALRGLSPRDVVLGALPMAHIFGIATILLTTFYAGGSVWLMPRFDPAAATAALTSGGVSVMHGVPTLYARLIAHLESLAPLPAFAALRYAYAGGGALDLELKRRVEAALRLPLHHGYGMTEYAGSMFVTPLARPRDDTSPGELNPECEVRFVRSDGAAPGPESPGEIWIRGPGTMRGYYRAPELTAQTLSSDGWLRTGDLGYLDTDGALRLAGRLRDLVKRSGFTVFPLEVETELASHPAVHQAAVIGVPSMDGDERLIAFVEPRAGMAVQIAELARHARARLSAYKVPQEFVLVERLPLTENGKVRKLELRATWIAGRRSA